MPNTSASPHQKLPAIRAYLGGSFDPVHKGHLEVALHVYQRLLPITMQQQRDLQVCLLPNARSPFKMQSTDPAHRLAMLRLAVQETPIQINELELWQTPPVYTIDSVRALRQQYPHDSLIFIMGMDSARSLDKWKEGLRLTDYVNLWVFNREDSDDMSDTDSEHTTSLIKKTASTDDAVVLSSQLPPPLQPYITHTPIDLLTPSTQCTTAYLDTDNTDLKNPVQGRIYIDTRPITAVSSTQIREQLQIVANQTNKMPASERQIASIAPINAIINHTEFNPLAKWLNPAVYHYIIAHQLYSAAQFR
ncbi:MAG: nicotinate-nicotinamide nucleotide adenylyltransferase [Psychrobacter sp.]|uniref:nicotinate-nicotinamide nucleotide adenylyltransferase n=1 Tax=Psychrobacter sp. TaxID=56811 RepID=UPI002647B73D|nr:nicotinate-nicotinamide nucleotide adenylyltransferase [Psychrobacter sp.]MDN5621262.1 nicotinate-nicotinamide nucleotide adenylyltransferase [Psychrobacter sp.]